MALPKGGQTLTATQFKFVKPGDFLIGKFVREGVTEIKGKVTKTYAFDCGDAGFVRILGVVQLDDALIAMQPSQLVGIEYKGEVKSGSGMRVKTFDVRSYEDGEEGVVLGHKSST